MWAPARGGRAIALAHSTAMCSSTLTCHRKSSKEGSGRTPHTRRFFVRRLALKRRYHPLVDYLVGRYLELFRAWLKKPRVRAAGTIVSVCWLVLTLIAREDSARQRLEHFTQSSVNAFARTQPLAMVWNFQEHWEWCTNNVLFEKPAPKFVARPHTCWFQYFGHRPEFWWNLRGWQRYVIDQIFRWGSRSRCRPRGVNLCRYSGLRGRMVLNPARHL